MEETADPSEKSPASGQVRPSNVWIRKWYVYWEIRVLYAMACFLFCIKKRTIARVDLTTQRRTSSSMTQQNERPRQAEREIHSSPTIDTHRKVSYFYFIFFRQDLALGGVSLDSTMYSHVVVVQREKRAWLAGRSLTCLSNLSLISFSWRPTVGELSGEKKEGGRLKSLGKGWRGDRHSQLIQQEASRLFVDCWSTKG